MLLILLIVIVLFVLLALKNWFINYVKALQIYGSIACPRNRLPLLGNLFQLPLNPHRKKSIRKNIRFLFSCRIFQETRYFL